MDTGQHDEDTRISALRATAHPARLRILSLLTRNAMSAAEVARELGLTHANASYHLRQLVDAGELVLAGEEKIRGGVAKRYRYPHERRGFNPQGGQTTSHDVVAYARVLAQELERRVLQRQRRTKGLSSDLEGWVPPDVWSRALALMEEASMLLHEHNHAPRTEGTVHVSATSWAFVMRKDAR